MHCKVSHDQQKYNLWERFFCVLNVKFFPKDNFLNFHIKLLSHNLFIVTFTDSALISRVCAWIGEWQRSLSTTSDSAPIVVNIIKLFTSVIWPWWGHSHHSMLPNCSVMATLTRMWCTGRRFMIMCILHHAASSDD